VVPEEEKQYQQLDVTRANPTQLFQAADTAWEKKDMVEAGFMLNAARIRGQFDMDRFDGISKGEESLDYKWDSMEEFVGRVIGRELVQDYDTWVAIVQKIEDWNVIPVDESQYKTEDYGSLVLPKEKWEEAAQKVKRSFLDTYAYKFRDFLKDPENADVWNYVNDYIQGYIEPTPENEKVFAVKLKALTATLKEHNLHAH